MRGWPILGEDFSSFIIEVNFWFIFDLKFFMLLGDFMTFMTTRESSVVVLHKYVFQLSPDPSMDIKVYLSIVPMPFILVG